MKHWEDVVRASTAALVTWAEGQPWARAMAVCAQDASWHAEGDVWTHTCLVIAELERLPEWPALDRTAQLMLLFTALFHDAGKPATTQVDQATGRTHAPKHALVGMEIGRRVLRELGCDLELREAILALVRFHGKPAHVLENRDPGREVIALSWLLRHRLLYLFGRADQRGRRSLETGRSEEHLELWRLVAEENGCFDRAYAFANDHARFLFYREELSSLHYVPHEDYRCRVTLLSGLPGAGKDTWLARACPELPVVSLDDLRAELDVDAAENQGAVVQEARERCRVHLRAGRAFAFNATNTVQQTRQRWIDLCADYGARIELVYLEPPLPTVLERNARRARPVPAHVIQRLIEKLEPPTWREAHGVRLLG